MNILILGDTHFDINNGNENILDNQLLFFKQQVIPYMIENNIKDIIQLGDFFDNRTKLSINVIQKICVDFFDLLQSYKINFYTLLGNHDLFYKDTRDVHSMYVFDRLYDNITLFKEISTLNIHNKKLLFVPWLINDELDMDKYKDVDYIFGHFETNGVEMTKGYECNSTHALEKDSFKSKITFSGHFHLKRNYNNLYYTGTPYQLNFGDFEESKGFHVLNLDNNDIEFIENHYSTKHITIIVNSDTKNIKVVGLNSKEIKISIETEQLVNLIDFSMFKNHKAKIYIDKDSSLTKKILKELEKFLLSFRVDLIEPEKVATNIEKIENTEGFDVVNNIKSNLITNYQKKIFNDIYTQSLIDLNS